MNFPNLTITQYYNAASTSHSKKLALDIAIYDYRNLNLDAYTKLSLYFSVFLFLESLMPAGRIRVAKPPYCLHFHTDMSVSKDIGFENLKVVDGLCRFVSTGNFTSMDNAIENIRVWMANPFWEPMVWPTGGFDIMNFIVKYWAEPQRSVPEIQLLLRKTFPVQVLPVAVTTTVVTKPIEDTTGKTDGLIDDVVTTIKDVVEYVDPAWYIVGLPLVATALAVFFLTDEKKR